MGAKYVDWPTDGPDKWITEWQKLMSDCERWCPPLYQLWASDFNLVWGEVPGAQRLCDRLIEAVTKNELGDWNVFRASMELRQAWDQRTIRSGMRVAGRGRITRAAFAVEPRFNGTEASGETDEPQSVPSDPPNSRKRHGPESHQRSSNKRFKRKPCWGCGGDHNNFTCVLIKGLEPRNFKIPGKNKTIFQEKMKDPAFAEKIRKLREAENIRKDLEKSKED